MSCASCSSPPLSIGLNVVTNAAFGNCPFNPAILVNTTVRIIATQLGPGFRASLMLTIPFNPDPQTIQVEINSDNILSATNTSPVTGDYTTVIKTILINNEPHLHLYLVPRGTQPTSMSPYYSFFFFYDGSVVNIRATYSSCGSIITTPSLPDGTVPNLFATASLTPLASIGQNICQVDFTVITGGQKYCDGLISLTELYRQYCVPIQDVICAKGCTLTGKIDNLNLDLQSFVSIALLRYILSKLLFGCFDVNYLRRRYYEQFLSNLKKSEWKAFLQYFNNDYWKSFKQ